MQARIYFRLGERIFTASSTCSCVDIPVERMIGFPVLARSFKNSLSVTNTIFQAGRCKASISANPFNFNATGIFSSVILFIDI